MKNEWKKLLSRFLVIYFFVSFICFLLGMVCFFPHWEIFSFVFCLTQLIKQKAIKYSQHFFLVSERKTQKIIFLKKSLSMSSEVSLVFTYLFYDPVTHILWHGKAGKWTKGKKDRKIERENWLSVLFSNYYSIMKSFK